MPHHRRLCCSGHFPGVIQFPLGLVPALVQEVNFWGSVAQVFVVQMPFLSPRRAKALNCLVFLDILTPAETELTLELR